MYDYSAFARFVLDQETEAHYEDLLFGYMLLMKFSGEHMRNK